MIETPREREVIETPREREADRDAERERVTEKLYTIREEKIHQHAQSVYTERRREETYERGRSDRESRLARKRER